MQLVFIIVCCILAACDNNVELNSKSCEDTKSDINFVSFNCAWAPGMVPRTLDRIGPGIEAIKNLDFDVLCLQETWLPEHRDALTVALNLPENQVFTIDTRNDDLGTRLGETSEDVCTDEELSGLVSCVKKNCSDIIPSEVSFCAQGTCSKEVKKLYGETKKDPACLRCIGAMAGKTIEDVSKTCTSSGASRIQDGNNDVMLMSRFPLLNKEYLILPSSSSNRVALFATVLIPNTEVKIEVACVHISASSFLPPSHSGFETWSGEKKSQIGMVSRMLLRRAKRKNREAVLMGDLNIGPKIENGKYLTDKRNTEKIWEQLQSDGFISPALEELHPICTGSCIDNKTDPTVGDGELIDHVLLHQPKDGAIIKAVCTDQVLNTPFKIKNEELSFSDHFGIRVKAVVISR